VAEPRFLADEMVGRLARYLRFVGCDTEYVRGASDAEILDRLARDGRLLLTRDRALARRAPRAVLLTSPHLADQWRALRAAVPDVPRSVRFDRCTACNGRLSVTEPSPADPRTEGVPWDRVAAGLALFKCEGCGHLYWDGTHVESVRRRLAAWDGERAP
jgi:uncharacterized protein